MNTKWIKIDDVIRMHSRVLKETGGLDGLRDEGVLQSALQAPLNGFEGREFYPSIEEKAARLLFGLVHNHPFVDGNKRTGWLAFRMVLNLNNKPFLWEIDDAEGFILSIAEGSIDYSDIIKWVRSGISDMPMVENQYGLPVSSGLTRERESSDQ